MDDRSAMSADDLMGRLMVGGIRPTMAHLTNTLGEHNVVFDYPARNGMERITVRFNNREDRDQWFDRYSAGFRTRR